MSQQELIEKIYNRYRNDPASFATSYTNIFTEQDGTNQELYEKQIEFLNLLKPTDKISSVVKCRQSGFSTSIKAKALHSAFFGKVPYILVASASQLQADKILREIKEAVLSIPEWLRPELGIQNTTEIHFKSGTKIVSLPANPKTCRGFPGSVFLDEFGVFSEKDSNEIWEALMPSILKGYDLVTVSTPKGKNNMFYHLCNPKMDEKGEIVGVRADKVVKVMWTDVPHVKKAVLEMELEKKMHQKSFLQEFCCQFLDDNEESFFSFAFIEDKLIDKGLSFVDLSVVDGSKGDTIGESYICRDIIQEFSHGVICGFDGNAGGEDGSICVAFGVNGEEWKMIALKMLPKGMEIDAQCDYYSRFCHFFNARKAGFDSTSGLGKAFEQKLRKTWAGKILYPFSFNNSSKLEEYTHLKNRIENHQMKAPEHSEMIKQFTVLGFNPVTKRIASMGSWRTNHDDIPSAIMVAHAARHKTNNSGFSFI